MKATRGTFSIRRDCPALLALIWSLSALSAPAQEDIAVLRNKVAQLVAKLGAEEFDVRENTTAQLIELGHQAIPLIAPYLAVRDPEVAARVRRILEQVQGTPGEATDGLTLTAALAGSKPQKGQTVTLWLTLKNVSDHDIYVIQYFWWLGLRPKPARPSGPVVLAASPDDRNVRDYLRLAPGQTLSRLMDADPEAGDDIDGPLKACLYIARHMGTEGVVPGQVFMGHLTSGPIELRYADSPVAPSPGVAALWDAYNTTGLAAGELSRKKEYGEVVQWGLRRPTDEERMKAFQLFLAQPRPDLEDALIYFLTRMGPRLRDEKGQNDGLLKYAQRLPMAARVSFLRRVFNALNHDWRAWGYMAAHLSRSNEAPERGLAAQVFFELIAQGDDRPEVAEFVAWEFFSNPDPKLRDPKKAIDVIQKLLSKSPRNPYYRCALACFQNDQQAMIRIAGEIGSASEQNSMAWGLVTKNRPTPAQAELALLLAQQAVKATKGYQTEPLFMDTLAVVYAAKEDFALALETEEKALELLPKGHGEYRDYAARVARFTALVKAARTEYPNRVLQEPPLHSPEARAALLSRLETEKNATIREEISRLLNRCFPDASPKTP
jgi:tetratricopeptide (TPR) repeat protein